MYNDNVYFSLYKKIYNDNTYYVIHEKCIFHYTRQCIMTTNIM